MAKVYAPPENIKTPITNYQDWSDEERYIQEVTDFCKSQSKCPHAGKVIKFPVADGYAMYMVFDYRTLLHLEIGDLWQIPEAHSRGLRKADIISEIEREQALKKLFGNNS